MRSPLSLSPELRATHARDGCGVAAVADCLPSRSRILACVCALLLGASSDMLHSQLHGTSLTADRRPHRTARTSMDVLRATVAAVCSSLLVTRSLHSPSRSPPPPLIVSHSVVARQAHLRRRHGLRRGARRRLPQAARLAGACCRRCSCTRSSGTCCRAGAGAGCCCCSRRSTMRAGRTGADQG